MIDQYRLEDNNVSGGNGDKEGKLVLYGGDERVFTICKKKGHTVSECRFNKKGPGKLQNKLKKYRFTGNCNNCGMIRKVIAAC